MAFSTLTTISFWNQSLVNNLVKLDVYIDIILKNKLLNGAYCLPYLSG